MKVKIGDLRVKQLSELCSRHASCYNCPVVNACADDPGMYNLEAVIEVPDDLFPKPVALCRWRNEDRCGMYCEGFDTDCENYKPVGEDTENATD